MGTPREEGRHRKSHPAAIECYSSNKTARLIGKLILLSKGRACGATVLGVSWRWAPLRFTHADDSPLRAIKGVKIMCLCLAIRYAGLRQGLLLFKIDAFSPQPAARSQLLGRPSLQQLLEDGCKRKGGKRKPALEERPHDVARRPSPRSPSPASRARGL